MGRDQRRGALTLSSGQLALDGTPSVVLCSSVFPFRIPRDQWDHRLQLVQESGYRMVDLYVHWGFHEEAPGTIDLTSPERDLQHFLDLARDRDLLVMARPGPYICSETDGGGLPWWLHGEAEGAPASLRTTDPDYLTAVDRWFGAVMPILAGAQVTRGGAVALVQIENELDFFDCPDPDAYMTHLVTRARDLGIEVPVIGCAGQGDLAGATGGAAEVVPTVNLYPDDSSVTFDEETRHYAGVLAGRDLPLLVTETNRLHRTLRREILAGARLVAPYLQTSGFDHLVLPSAGNWGDPGNLMTHDYDFGGYISPDGRRRPEYDEAITLAATLDAWGARLATATPVPLDEAAVEGAVAGGALALEGGGHIVGPAEVGGSERRVRLHSSVLEATRPQGRARKERDALLAPGACPFWALDVPLEPWGGRGTLAFATAELVDVKPPCSPADGAPSTPLTLTFEGDALAQVVLVLTASDGTPEELRLLGLGTARSATAEPPVEVELRERPDSLADPEPSFRPTGGEVLEAADVMAGPSGESVGAAPSGVPGAEAAGLPDGRLRAELEISPEATELLLLGAADLVRLDLDGRDLGVQVPHGAPLSLELAPGASHRLIVESEIWGRANFDDARRPALRLGAGRGIGTALEVLATRDITDLWEVRELPDRRGAGPLADPPLRELGGWSSANPGAMTTYARRLRLPGASHGAVLRLHGLDQPVHIAVGDGAEQLVVPACPVVVLDDVVAETTVRLRAPHVPGGLVERAELLTTAAPAVVSFHGRRESELASHLDQAARAATVEEWRPLPSLGTSTSALRVGAGRPVLIRLEDDGEPGRQGWLLDLHGEDVEITVLAGGRRVSRHVLGLPVTAGGEAGRSWIPAGWCEGDAREVLLLVEGLGVEGGIFRQVKSSRTSR